MLSFQKFFTSQCRGVGVPESMEPVSFQDVSQRTVNQSGEHSFCDLTLIGSSASHSLVSHSGIRERIVRVKSEKFNGLRSQIA